MYAPPPSSAVAIRSVTTLRIHEAAGEPSRNSATMIVNGVLPAAKLLVPSRGSTTHTAPPSPTRPTTSGSAATASSPTTEDPGRIRVSPVVSARSDSRSTTVTRSPGAFCSTSSESRRRNRGSTMVPATSRISSSTRSSTGRQLHDAHEELVDLADHRYEPVEVDRFGHVRVRMQLVAAHDVLVGCRGGQHHNRDPSQVFVLLDLGEHLASIAPRQVEVEQDQ